MIHIKQPNIYLFSQKAVFVVLAFFATTYALISLVNHFYFRTNALDLGMFNQALYMYSRGTPAHFSQSLDGSVISYLCDHFSPIIILLCPLRFLGTYILLILQIVALLMGGYYCYKIALAKQISTKYAWLFPLFFLSLWPAFAAISYDFHANVISASMLPVVYYLFTIRSYRRMLLAMILCLLCKENSGIYVMALFLVIACERGLTSRARILCLGLASLSVMYVLFCLKFLIPSFCDGVTSNVAGFYGYFGNDFMGVIKGVLTNPLDALQLFVNNEEHLPAKTKITTFIFLAFSGGVFILLRPSYLILLFVILAQKFLSSNQSLWDIHGHYSIEFVPLIVLASISFFSKVGLTGWKTIFLSLSILLALFMSWRGPISRNESSNIFSLRHYRGEINHEEFESMLALIPESASVCCTNHLSPHISFRSLVYLFPNVKESEFVFLEKNIKNTYPQSLEEFKRSVLKLNENTDYELVAESFNLSLYRRKSY